MSESVDRLRVIFRGDVQGVGFRYTARRAASAYPRITGTVSNLPDGTVELNAEGPLTDIDSLISDISRRMSTYISDIERHASTGTRIYSGFRIIV